MRKILFIRLRLLGDIIFTIPAIEIYKKYFPENRIYYVVEERFREISELIPEIHEVIVIPRYMTLKEHFKFRNKIGMDVVLEALKLYKSRKKFDLEKLLMYSEVCRVKKIIVPYLEAMI